MGNSSSSSSSGRHHEDTVDYGALAPQGVYTGAQDWNQSVVTQLIIARKLAPFYRPLEEYEESWDDDQILAARKELPDSAENIGDHPARPDPNKSGKRSGPAKEFRPEVAVYRGSAECPICFLYYPSNINYSRCCDQAICTECFVQIKRAEPTATHLVSEPAACPYCVQDNFGVVYTPPLWRAGIGSDGASPLVQSDVTRLQSRTSIPTHKRRQKSYSADSAEVVTIDQIRPDWEAKLAAVRAAVARRANRRIIMRQVGDRLVPVGIGRVQTPEEAAAEAASGGSRRRRHHNANGNAEGYVGVSGQDLEELMLMEAMRLSLIDHEEHQKKEAEERKKRGETDSATTGEGPSSQGEVGPSTSVHLASRPSPAPRVPSDSLAPPHPSGSTSRSRTPPTVENNTSWSSRSPPPFSTLNAALLSSGTASAFLNSSRPPIFSSSEPAPAPAANVQHDGGSLNLAAQPNTTSISIPSQLSFVSGEVPHPSSLTSSAVSSPSSLAAESLTYGHLPSSPESVEESLLHNAASIPGQKTDVSGSETTSPLGNTS